MSGGRILGVQAGQTTAQIIPGIVQQSNKTALQQTGTLTVAVSCVPSNILGTNIVAQVQRATTVATVGAGNTSK